MGKLGDFDTAHTLSDQDIVSTLARIHSDETSLAASRLALLAEADRRGLAMKLGQSSIKRWYGRATRIPEGNVAHQVALGYWLGANPTVANALADGTIHYLHAKAIADGLATVVVADPLLDDQARTDVVAVLLDVATRSLARAVTDRAQELAHRAAADARARHDAEERARKAADNAAAEKNTDAGSDDESVDDGMADTDTGPPDGVDDAAEHGGSGSDETADKTVRPAPLPVSENTALNSLIFHLMANGRYKFEGDFDVLTYEMIKNALSDVAAPTPAEDGTRDPRSPSRRNADGLRTILERYMRGRSTPGGGGGDVKLIVSLAELLAKSADADPEDEKDDVAAGSPGTGAKPTPGDANWPFHLDWAGAISRYLAEYLTCDALLTPVIVDHHGVPLVLGRTFRLATAGQRQAVIVRDRCCVMCGRPAQWCQVHHVEYWQHGGHTDLNNLALVCSECHRQIHNAEWQLVMGEDGHPYVIPPALVDPDQRPIPSYHRRRKRTA